ncbi:hypothetical protein HNR23_000716 [Nocardiopsis mwathae]|uniref:Secreted protein n=1 Tax=Nocardiopsis mwathae TaxID=1472723 RepID=A0A7W9YFQ9_9ACTN|nr:hypothetical protein [Nocardiopsis mwathae]MBB6170656.1 hypothetical protein [Nocardiopsis mwathae]
MPFMKRTFRYIAVPAAALTLSLTALSSASADADNSDEGDGASLPDLGTASASNSDWGDSTVTVNQLVQSDNGGYTSLTWTVHDQGGNKIRVSNFRNTVFPYGAQGLTPANGVALLDTDNEIRFYPSKDDEGECLCSGPRTPRDYATTVPENGEATYWAAFDLPEGLSSVDIEIPGFQPVTNVPVG